MVEFQASTRCPNHALEVTQGITDLRCAAIFFRVSARCCRSSGDSVRTTMSGVTNVACRPVQPNHAR